MQIMNNEYIIISIQITNTKIFEFIAVLACFVDTVKKWMTNCNSSLQIKRLTTLKNGQMQVRFWKKSIVFTMILQINLASSSCFQELKALNTSKEQLFGESWQSPLQVQMFTAALLKNLPYRITAIAAVRFSN